MNVIESAKPAVNRVAFLANKTEWHLSDVVSFFEPSLQCGFATLGPLMSMLKNKKRSHLSTKLTNSNLISFMKIDTVKKYAFNNRSHG